MKLQNPTSIAIDAEGRIYVADRFLDAVQVFDPTGSFVFSFDGTTGGGT